MEVHCKRKRSDASDCSRKRGSCEEFGCSADASTLLEDAPSVAVARLWSKQNAFSAFVQEVQKYGSIEGSSKTARACRSHGPHVGLRAIFSRILWSQKLHEDLRSEPSVDGVFPITKEHDEPVVRELVEFGRTVEQASAIVAFVQHEICECALQAQQRRAAVADVREEIVFLLDGCGMLVDNTMKINRRSQYVLVHAGHELPVQGSHLLKLLTLYKRHTNADATLDDTDFLRRAFCVVCCYETLSGDGGAGYQMALPPVGFEALRSLFDVHFECFASPLNATLEHYCSVSPCTDRFFGSVGSFWHFCGGTRGHCAGDAQSVREGSFEVNPPFVEDMMEHAVQRIQAALEAAECSDFALSFTVLMPAWEADACAAFKLMTTSQFARPTLGYYLVLEKGHHTYCPGMQHRTSHAEQPSKVNTLVFFLQTSRGAAKWPVTDAKLQSLQTSLKARANRLNQRRICSS